MSGIAGIIKTNLNQDSTPLKEISRAMGLYLSEPENIFISKQGLCGLVFLGEKNQESNLPFQTKDGDYALTFDGEIYNYEEIKEKLLQEGVQFETTTSSEIILQAFLHWREKCVEYFNGQFSFAVWDNQMEQLHLFRDRVGIKAIYYALSQGVFYFSSELDALTQFIDKRKWNEDAIHHYFRLGYIPAPQTIYQQIQKLDEASFLKVAYKTTNSEQKVAIVALERYWKLEKKISKKVLKDEAIAKEELREILVSSVEARLKGKEKKGAFLSGGVDSSLITSIAQSLSDQPIPTFSIGFKEASHNETHYAKQVADTLKTDHHELIISHKDAQDLITQIPDWYGQPYADSSALPSYIVAKMASEKVQTVLTGDGGDEQFLGYGMYLWAERLAAFKHSRGFFKTLLNLSSKANHKRVSQYFDYKDGTHVPSHIFSVDQGFYSEKQLKKHFNFVLPASILSLQKTHRKLFANERQALFDLKYYLPGDLTVKIDRVVLQNKIEARAPLLDYRLLEWSLNLDPRLKRKNGEDKYLLKQLLYDYLPKSIFDRPKWGFGIPLGKWLGTDLKPLLDKYVNKEILEKYPFYKVEEILETKNQFLKGHTFLYNKLWLIIVFNMWAEKIKD